MRAGVRQGDQASDEAGGVMQRYTRVVGGMILDDQGRWVRYDDYQRLADLARSLAESVSRDMMRNKYQSDLADAIMKELNHAPGGEHGR